MKDVRTPYDLFEPPAGHRERFARKTERLARPAPPPLFLRWVAAAILIGVGIFFLTNRHSFQELSSRWTPAPTATRMLVSYLDTHLPPGYTYDSPAARRLIEDASRQLERLETDYQRLQKEFARTGNPMVLDAMIDNTRRKMRLLEELKRQLIQTEQNIRHEKGHYSL
ncbi:MAG: hypothetical protein GXO27_00575 [Chlorobi bacterium]|nr:hypothetical protein [Chlorobiota bacterium]